MMKRRFSLLLIFMLVFSMIPVNTLKVSAKATTATATANTTRIQHNATRASREKNSFFRSDPIPSPSGFALFSSNPK